MSIATPQEVLHFWFEELGPADRFRKSETLDKTIRERFLATHAAVIAGETADWRDTAPGRLAEVIVLDQFSRNMYRDTAAAFAADPQALTLSQEAIRQGDDQQLEGLQRVFLYMPFMHSESVRIHEQALTLFADFPDNLEFEIRHKAIIDRFGRYPYRNAILGRESTPEELSWLETNSSF